MGIAKKWIGAILIVVILIGSFPLILNLFSRPNNSSTPDVHSSTSCSPIHWHPTLKIIIDGQEQLIPNNIGVNIGNIIDTDLSGMGMAPTHTHEEVGTIHMENNCPNKKPESYTLGYFFKVWGKPFNETCVFDYCNDRTKRVRMTVNGQENNEFGSYKMRDGDQIVISYGE